MGKERPKPWDKGMWKPTGLRIQLCRHTRHKSFLYLNKEGMTWTPWLGQDKKSLEHSKRKNRTRQMDSLIYKGLAGNVRI